MKCYVNYQQNDWIKWFSTTKFVYNNSFHSVTNKFSFELIFDGIVDLNQKIQKFYKKKISIVRNWIVIFANTRKYLKLKWIQTTRSVEKNYNKKHFHVKFNVDQMMFLNAKNIRSIRSSKKLNYKYYDSYRMLKFVERISYRFQFFAIINEIYNVFYVSFLKFCKSKNSIVSSIFVNEKKKWKIENIINMRKREKKKIFLIK